MADEIKIIATNRKARHEYAILDTLEAGIVLTGTEIKSIRAGKVNIQEGYVTPQAGELWALNMHIASYELGYERNHEPRRPRKLLLHRKEIKKWAEDVRQKGFTIIPLRLYLKRGRAKLEIALAKGKKLYDKRQAISEREAKRRIDRALADSQRGRR